MTPLCAEQRMPVLHDRSMAVPAPPSTSFGGVIQNHLGVIASAALAIYIAMRVAFVAELQYSTAVAIIREQGTAGVVFGAILSGATILPSCLLGAALVVAIQRPVSNNARTWLVAVDGLILLAAFVFAPWYVALLYIPTVALLLIVYLRVRNAWVTTAGEIAETGFHALSQEAAVDMLEASRVLLFHDVLDVHWILREAFLAGEEASPRVIEIASENANRINGMEADLADYDLNLAELQNTRESIRLRGASLRARLETLRESKVSSAVRRPLILGALLLIGIPLVISPMWLPRESVRAGNQTYDGYVLGDDGRWMTILSDGLVLTIDSRSVDDRVICDPEGGGSRSIASLVLTQGDDRVPSCREVHDNGR